MKTALVAGSAKCVGADLRAARKLCHRPAIIAVNFVGGFLRQVDHIVSLHGDMPDLIMHIRENSDATLREHQPNVVTHSNRQAPGVDRVWDFPATGSSSLFGVRVALGLAFERVICCGVPLDSSGRFHDIDEEDGRVIWDWSGPQGDQYREDWRLAKEAEFKGRVFSMSGWTRELLGAPA